jgi:hypothetical protein
MKKYSSLLKKILLSLVQAKPEDAAAAFKVTFGTKEGRVLAIYRPAMMVVCFFTLLIFSGKVLEITDSIIACLISAALLLHAFNWVLTHSEPAHNSNQ